MKGAGHLWEIMMPLPFPRCLCSLFSSWGHFQKLRFVSNLRKDQFSLNPRYEVRGPNYTFQPRAIFISENYWRLTRRHRRSILKHHGALKSIQLKSSSRSEQTCQFLLLSTQELLFNSEKLSNLGQLVTDLSRRPRSKCINVGRFPLPSPIREKGGMGVVSVE